MSDGRPRKQQRISRACDLCHRRSIRCRGSEKDPSRCQNCYDFDVPCTYDRPTRRGRLEASGAPRRPTNDHAAERPLLSATPGPALADAKKHGNLAERSSIQPERLNYEDRSTPEPLGQAWRAFAVATESVIRALLDVYFEVVYPIFPLFHRPTLLERIKRRDYLADRGYFASIMAACALASARVRDGALLHNNSDRPQLAEPPSETFYAAARDAIPKDLVAARGLDYLRACALLALASIQNGQIDEMHQYRGNYFSLMIIGRLHDEIHWPKELSIVECEERRRLFWSIYTLDVFASVVWNGCLSSQEVHSRVKYPTEIDDEYITNDSIRGGFNSVSWLRGWNFTTDLYRVMEHAVNRLRSRHPRGVGSISIGTLFGKDLVSGADILQTVMATYSQLPIQFKEILPVTSDRASDLFGFQAANIQATLQLLRMVFFSIEENVDVDAKCNVASELLSVFHAVPVPYLRAISTPLVFHLGGIGTILGSVMEGPLSESSYLRVRTMLLSMADLLQNLEYGLHFAAGTSDGLRAQVGRIDEYMRTQQRPSDQVPQNNSVSSSNGLTVYPNDSDDPLLWFQLPPELLEEWPWPFDTTQNFTYGPTGFE